MVTNLPDVDDLEPVELISLEKAVGQYRALSGAVQYDYEYYRAMAHRRGYVAFPERVSTRHNATQVILWVSIPAEKMFGRWHIDEPAFVRFLAAQRAATENRD